MVHRCFAHGSQAWPAAGSTWDAGLVATVRQIFEESILDEIELNVIEDAHGNLEHRGHVVAICVTLRAGLFLPLKVMARRRRRQIPQFALGAHFPTEIIIRTPTLPVFACIAVQWIHSWNLFEAAITSGETILSQLTMVFCVSDYFISGCHI